MNERIKLLAKSSDINIDNFWNDDYSNNRLEKFAELIVRECIANCDDENSQQYIMSHFGLKESDWS